MRRCIRWKIPRKILLSSLVDRRAPVGDKSCVALEDLWWHLVLHFLLDSKGLSLSWIVQVACSLPKPTQVIAVDVGFVIVRRGAISVDLVTEDVILHEPEPILVMSPNNTLLVHTVNAADWIGLFWEET